MGPVIRLKHTHLIRGRWRWIPPKWMRAKGAVGEYLTPDDKLTDKAFMRSKQLTDGYEAEFIEVSRTHHGSLKWAIDDYEKSDWYNKLEKSTKNQEWDPLLKFLRDTPIANIHVTRIKRKQVRELYDGCINRGLSRDKANRVIKVLRRVLFWCIELGLIEVNPATKMNLKKNPPRRVLWTGEEVRLIIKTAIAMNEHGIALATAIGYDTSQRLSDILKVNRKRFSGGALKFHQSKTGKDVIIPLRQQSIDLINQMTHASVTIIADRDGQPYRDRKAFNNAFRAVKAASGITRDLTFRDLRRTVASEILAGGGRSEPITGHEPGSPVLRVYEVPSLSAAKTAQALRKEFTETENEE